MPKGRPSKYDPAMCEAVIAAGEEGMGRAEIAAEIGADHLIYQEVADMEAAIIEGSTVERLEMSCFNGEYVTGTVSDEYLRWVEANQSS
mgnify:CR=1 FL=1